MKIYDLIIFDCDGVLVDSETISMNVLVEMAAEQGASLDPEYAVEHFAGRNIKHIFNHLEQTIGRALPDDFEQEFRRRTFEEFGKSLKPITGMPEILNKLSIDKCVASNGPREKIIRNLKTTGLFHHFEGAVFSSYDIQTWKPKPDLFLNAARTMGHDVENCLVIEDSVTGVQAAVNGGFDVVAFIPEHKVPNFDHLTSNFAHNAEQVEKWLV